MRLFLTFDSNLDVKDCVLPISALDKLSGIKDIIVKSILKSNSVTKDVEMYLVHEDQRFLLLDELPVKDSLRDGDKVAVVVKIQANGSTKKRKFSDINSVSDDSDDDSSSSDSDFSLGSRSSGSSISSDSDSDSSSSPSASSEVSSSAESAIERPEEIPIPIKRGPEPDHKSPKIPKDLVENLCIVGMRKPVNGLYFNGEPFTVEDLNYNDKFITTEHTANSTNHYTNWDDVYSHTCSQYYGNENVDYSMAPKKKRKKNKKKATHVNFEGVEVEESEVPNGLNNDYNEMVLINQIDFSVLPLYEGLPVVNDKIVFKMLEMNLKTFSPQISPYKLAEITAYDEASDFADLKILQVFSEEKNGKQGAKKKKLPSQVFASSFSQEQEVIQVEWKSLIEIKKYK